MTPDLPNEVTRWALRNGGTEVIRHETQELAGGAVAQRVDLITFTIATPSGEAEQQVVRKWGFPFEVTALRAAQAVRDRAHAIPELIAEGVDEEGPWFVIPYYDSSQPAGQEPDAELFESLAELHVRYRGGDGALAGIPTVDAEWWAGLCLRYTLTAIVARRQQEPHPVLDRAEAVIREVAEHEAVARVLDCLPRTLVHNDVHAGNLIISSEHCMLIDWGSARVGPAMLDLANLAQPDSTAFERYADRWRVISGAALPPEEIEGGFRWARLQLPVQYFAWVVGTQPIDAVVATIKEVEQALDDVVAWAPPPGFEPGHTV